MDGTPGSTINPTHNRVTAALAVATDGDTIKIKGMTHPQTGFPMAYSDNPVHPLVPAESFPMTIPPGVTLKPYDSSAVYVWSTASTPPSHLFELGTAAAQNPTRLAQLTFAGAQTLLRLHRNGGSSVDTVQLKECRFIVAEVGVSAIVNDDARMVLQIVDCDVTDAPTPNVVPPLSGPTSPAIGILLHANEINQGNIPLLECQLSNLTSIGQFASTTKRDFNATPNDIFDRGILQVSRLVDLHVSGVTSEWPDRNTTNPNPIALVELEINGGNWDGDSLGEDDSGWDIGLYTSAVGQLTTGSKNYTCGYSVEASGLTIQDFRIAGIYATAHPYSRGQVRLDGQSILRTTGSGTSGRAAGEYLRSGFHAFSFESYLGIGVLHASLEQNASHGLYLAAWSTIINEGQHPQGLYLLARDSAFHFNGGDGISMAGGRNMATGNYVSPCVIGGTWQEQAANGTRTLVGSPANPLPNGQGIVERCAISNNGEHGVKIYIAGGDNILSNAGFANVRFVNDIIWNNLVGGFLGVLDRNTVTYSAGPYLLAPLVHCTLAGNGDLPDPSLGPVSSVEICELFTTGTTQASGIYKLHDVQGPYLVTTLVDSILQRKNPADQDLGPFLDSRLIVWDQDANYITISSPNKVLIEGLRAMHSGTSWPEFSLLNYHTTLTSPFNSGTPNWTDTNPSQFFLSNGAPQVFRITPNWLNAGGSEAVVDYSKGNRDPIGSREMGADEI